jgi:hypothetical protein
LAVVVVLVGIEAKAQTAAIIKPAYASCIEALRETAKKKNA